MNSQAVTAYPLCWPAGWRRIEPEDNWRFSRSHTIASTLNEIERQVNLMGGYDLIVSTNLRVRRSDGRPISEQAHPKDPAAVIYFQRDDQKVCLACDKWLRIEHNLHSLGRTLDALRLIERDGSSDLLRRAFTGFAALPLPIALAHWSDVLNVPKSASQDVVEAAFIALARKHHPDNGGDPVVMREVLRAREQFYSERRS